jgi:cytochrome c peroxidase
MHGVLRSFRRRAPHAGASAVVLLFAALAACACGAPTNPSSPPMSGGSAGAPNPSDPDPVLTAEQMTELRALAPEKLPAPPADATNRFADDDRAAAFGQRLFFDTTFSGPLLDSDNDGNGGSLGKTGETGRVACASCHLPESGFSDTRSFQLQISLGAGWGRRRAPSLLDVGQTTLVLWDGRRDTLYNQVFGPLESVVEMNSSRLFMAQQIERAHKAEYEAIFGELPPLSDTDRFAALPVELSGCQPKNPTDPQPECNGPFHGSPGDRAEFDGLAAADQTAVTRVIVNAGKAIGAFERRLSCGTSPFDAWMRGDADAISRAAQRGAGLFVGKAKCVSCHSGPFMSDQNFHNVGLAPDIVQQAFIDANDYGASKGIADALADPLNSRGAFSDGDDGRLPDAVEPAMDGAFRTPMLRCVNKRPTFMHTGQLGTLAKVVDFFDKGGMSSGYPGTNELQPLGLSALEKTDLIAFLQSLDGPGPDAKYLEPLP